MTTTTKRKTSPLESLEISGFLPTTLLVVVTLVFLVGGFLMLRDVTIPQAIMVVLAIVWGVGAVVALYYTGNKIVEQLPEKWMRRLQPFVFVGPALLILGLYLLFPTVLTLRDSFFNANSSTFVGLENYVNVFTRRIMTDAWGNNILWMVVGTTLVVGLGLLIAMLADRSSFERVAKSLIFMPMAISMVGAGVIWKFVYDINPNIGLLNAIATSSGGSAQPWLQLQPANNIMLIIVVVWLQTGYAMVLISAAIKGVPDDLLEAARVDGASELRIFRSIILPSIAPTLVTVITTIIIFTLKVFDIVMVMTGGQFNTEVIGVRFYREMFNSRDAGMASAIAVVLLLAVVPIMIYNLRQFNKRDTF
jgi:alpha-glucoside transport system permease protein